MTTVWHKVHLINDESKRAKNVNNLYQSIERRIKKPHSCIIMRQKKAGTLVKMTASLRHCKHKCYKTKQQAGNWQ